MRLTRLVSLRLLLLLPLSLVAVPSLGVWQRSGLDGQTVYAIACDPTSANVIYAATFQKIWKSVDGGAHWTDSHAGYTGDAATGIFIDPTNPSSIVVGSNGGVFRSTNGGTTWTASSTGLVSTFVLTLAGDPSNPQSVWASVSSASGGVHHSTDGGRTWTAKPLGVPFSSVTAFAFRGSTVYAGWTDILWASTDDGPWTQPYPDTLSGNIQSIVVSPADGELVVAVNPTGVKRSATTAAWNSAIGGLTSLQITTLAQRPNDPQTIYAGSKGGAGVFRSSDAGRTWNPASSNLANTDIWALAFRADGNGLFAGTMDGVFVLDASGAGGGCSSDANALCLNGGRFRVGATWRVPSQGTSGTGVPTRLTDDTGTFWFFSAQNLELMVKVVDGRAFNGRYWVFFGALSDVEYTVTVTDTVTGAVRTYSNPSGTLASIADTNAF